MRLTAELTIALVAAFVVFLGSACGTRGLLAVLKARGIYDVPNERSSHRAPVPRGGGIAVMIFVLPSWVVIGWRSPVAPGELWWMVLGGLILATLSWVDDLRDLKAGVKFGAQIAVVSAAVVALDQPRMLFQGFFPARLDAVICGVAWVVYINLFNFMDGVDGNAGGKAVSLGAGLFGLALIGIGPKLTGLLALQLAAGAAGFLLWNWHPARIFMGDVGSVPFGFLFGYLLLRTAANRLFVPAAILPLYYVADFLLTLIPRIARGGAFWRPHREHTYQQAAVRGVRHDRIVWPILIGNVPLFGCAVVSVRYSVAVAVAGAVATVAVTLFYISRLRPRV